MRAVEQIVADLLAAGLDQKQTALVLELVIASTRLSGGQQVDDPPDAIQRRRKWDREYRRNRRLRDRLASTAASTRQVDKGATLSSSSFSSLAQQTPKEVREKKAVVVVEKEKRSRGARLPEDWRPSDDDFRFATAHGLRLVEIEIEATKFRNYWTNRTDRQASKPRWDLAWQNWILNVKPKGGPHGAGPAGRPQRGSGADFFTGLATVAADIAGHGAMGGNAAEEIPLGRVNIEH